MTAGDRQEQDQPPDPYLRLLHEHWDAIVGMHRAGAKIGPLVEFDVASGHILIYAADEYLNTLSARTRDQARTQYRKAIAEGALMVFVRDDVKKVLRSYVFPPSSPTS